jgi:serine/threonine protein kinase/tetratricopeptide (TPR) repeat protein
MVLAAGSHLGPYEILAPLGAGGMGEVYRARDTRLGRDVAVKIIAAGSSLDGDRLRRFEQEARTASALNHPNILTVHDFGTHDGAPYVVTELLHGVTLKERLAMGALSPRRAIDYAVQIAHGLAAAHGQGIVHRDLKPDNIFVTADERIKILDFGLAKLTTRARGDAKTNAPTQPAGTEPGIIMGTVGYMSPEQVRGEPADARSDLFAFGAVLYEMLTGNRAFRGDSAIETMNAILKAEPPEPSRSQLGVTPSLDHIVRRCLEKSPATRFQSADDLGFALTEAASVSSSSPVAGHSAERRRFGSRLVLGISLTLLIAGLIALGIRDRFRAGAAGRIQSLAVLPLTNLSRDPEQEYFADGMTEELITDLAQIGSLRVISRTSVMAFKGTKKSLPEIGRELKVDGVLEGSVARAGNRVRITAQLIEASTDRHLWAKSYERDLTDVLSLQSDVAQAVAHEVRAAVTPEEQARLGRIRPVDPEVHELYLKGRQHVSMGVEPEIRAGIALFERALAKNPQDARSWAGLADAWSGLSDFYRPPREVMPKAKEAAQKALELDDSLAEAHASLGNVYLLYEWKWAESERELRRAIELNPGFAQAHDWYGALLASIGRRTEWAKESRLAEELDPLSPIVHFDAGLNAFLSRQPDDAIQAFRRAIEIEPGFDMAHGWLALPYVQKGLIPEALREARQVKLENSPFAFASAGGAMAMAGDEAGARDALRRLEEISKSRYVCPYELGVIHIWLGEKNEGIRWLEKGYEVRSQCMPGTKVDPRLDPIRSDPRYTDLVKRLAFPP